jgi:hypothetical protein
MLTWLIPAVIAGLVAIAVTVAIEKLGGKKGGLLGTLPTTIIPATFGMVAVSPTVTAFQDALFMTPAGMLINAVFLLLWRVIPPRLPPIASNLRLLLCLAVTMLAWVTMATIIVFATPAVLDMGINTSTFSLILMGCGVVLGVVACLKTPPSPPATAKVAPLALIARGLLAATAIAAALWLAEHNGPWIAGMAAVFPAIFVTTMCTLWVAHGEAVGSGAVGPMMLGGTSVSAFAWLAAWWIPVLGVTLACLAAWFTAVAVITLPAWWWLSTKR